MRKNEQSGGLMLVTSGWYGLGHVTPTMAIIESLRRQSSARISLFTLPFEVPRLERRGQRHLFDAIYVGAEGDCTDYQEYIIPNYVENRLRFHHAFHIERPSVVLFHWMMLIEVIDVACLSQCRVVALLEENEWGNVVPGETNVRYFQAVDDVIFCDSVRYDSVGLRPRQHRVGHIVDFVLGEDRGCEAEALLAALKLPAGLPLILINTGGGTYKRTHRYLKRIVPLCALRTDLSFLIMIGPLVPSSICEEIEAAAGRFPNLAVLKDPGRDRIRQLIHCANLVINSGGISSTAECIALRKKFLAINPVGSDSTNDLCRIHELVRKGLCTLLELDEDTSLTTLSEAINRALSSSPDLSKLRTDGAEQAATLIKNWLESSVEKAVSTRSTLICFIAPDVKSSVRLSIKRVVPSEWDYIAVDLAATALDCSLSTAIEVDRCHKLVAGVGSYRQAVFFAVMGTDPIYDRLLHFIQIDRDIFAVSDRPLSLNSRFVFEVSVDSVPQAGRQIELILGNSVRWFRVKPPAPEYESYVDATFSPFTTTR